MALPAHRQRRVDREQDEEGPAREGVKDLLGRDRGDDPARPPRLCDELQQRRHVVEGVRGLRGPRVGRQLLRRRCWLIGSTALLRFRVAALLSGRRGQMQLLEAVVFHQILGHGGLAGTLCCVIVLVNLVSSIRDRTVLAANYSDQHVDQ